MAPRVRHHHPAHLRPHRSVGGSWASSPSSSSPSRSVSCSSRAPGRKVPAPFGPAANGSVAYARNGDIFTVDPKTGISIAVITGPDTDASPVCSRDGTRILFYRAPADLRSAASELVVADADGSRLVVITKQHELAATHDPNSYVFSPDGKEVMFTATGHGTAGNEIWIAEADGNGERRLEVGMGVDEATFLPPAGSEIIFNAVTPDGISCWDLRRRHGERRCSHDRGAARRRRSRPRPPLARWLADRVFHINGRSGPGLLPGPRRVRGWHERHRAADAPRGEVPGQPRNGRTTGRHSPSPAVTPSTTKTWCSPWCRPMDPALVSRPSTDITGCCDTNYEWSPDDSTILVTPEDAKPSGRAAAAVGPRRPERRPRLAGFRRATRPGSEPFARRPFARRRPPGRSPESGATPPRGLQQVLASNRPARWATINEGEQVT